MWWSDFGRGRKRTFARQPRFAQLRTCYIELCWHLQPMKLSRMLFLVFSYWQILPKFDVGLQPLSGYKQICLIYFTLIHMISLLHDLGLRLAFEKTWRFDSRRNLTCRNLPGTHQAFTFPQVMALSSLIRLHALHLFRHEQTVLHIPLFCKASLRLTPPSAASCWRVPRSSHSEQAGPRSLSWAVVHTGRLATVSQDSQDLLRPPHHFMSTCEEWYSSSQETSMSTRS